MLAHWGDDAQVKLLEKIFARIAEVQKPLAGTVLWLQLNWYPVLLLIYATGISALAAGRLSALRVALLAPVPTERTRVGEGPSPPVILPTIDSLTEIVDTFRMLPDMERKYVPRSEHIFKRLQPVLEDQLFLGRSYESLFDDRNHACADLCRFARS